MNKSVLFSRRKPQIRIPACQRLRQHSAYVPAPACQRHGRRTSAMPAHTAMAGRSLAMAGRSKFVLFSRRKPQTNSKFKCQMFKTLFSLAHYRDASIRMHMLFRILCFGHSYLFRASDFEFRIFRLARTGSRRARSAWRLTTGLQGHRKFVSAHKRRE